MISGNYIFRACPERTKAMTGTVRAVHKRREGAAGVSSHEAAPNARPGAALLNRRLGRDGFPSVSGAMSARARPAKLGGTTEQTASSYRDRTKPFIFIPPPRRHAIWR